MNSRRRLRFELRNFKSKRTLEYLGCSADDLRDWLESQFTEGMTWENYGVDGWHVDHRTPLASASTMEELVLLLHYSNLQPLWAADNLSKGARIIC
jgi:hypothetical protein